MKDDIDTLTEREKETLRLLLAGHDAKSIAATLDLSVHTIHDRLRDSRRKLGVSSSREAARMLGRAEAGTPEKSGPQKIGMGDAPPPVEPPSPPQRRRSIGQPLVWLGGGMIIMSLIIATLIFTAIPGQNGAPPPAQASDAQSEPIAANAPSVLDARHWVALLDKGEWGESWSKAASMFRNAVSQDEWVSKVQPLREPMGAVASRTFASGHRMTALPSGTKGNYALVIFQTDFANVKGATETVTLIRQNGDWNVIGYSIRTSSVTSDGDGKPDAPSATAARAWAEVLDKGDWAESWSEAASLFRDQVSQDKWVSQVSKVREPLGAVKSRSFLSEQPMTTLPDGTTGNYALVQFRTDFANAKGSTETVTLSRENGAWKVIGYFIR